MRDEGGAWAGGKLREGEEACGGEGKEGSSGLMRAGVSFVKRK